MKSEYHPKTNICETYDSAETTSHTERQDTMTLCIVLNLKKNLTIIRKFVEYVNALYFFGIVQNWAYT